MANLLKELVVHECASGGLLYEFVRDEEFGQLAIRAVPPGVTVGKHKHSADEWWLVVKGEGIVRLEYPDHIRVMHVVSGERPQIIQLPAWTGHEITNTAEGGKWCLSCGRLNEFSAAECKDCGDSEFRGEDLIFIFWAAELYDPDTHVKESWEW